MRSRRAVTSTGPRARAEARAKVESDSRAERVPAGRREPMARAAPGANREVVRGPVGTTGRRSRDGPRHRARLRVGGGACGAHRARLLAGPHDRRSSAWRGAQPWRRRCRASARAGTGASRARRRHVSVRRATPSGAPTVRRSFASKSRASGESTMRGRRASTYRCCPRPTAGIGDARPDPPLRAALVRQPSRRRR